MKNVEDIHFTRQTNDVNGNPRYAFHFLALVTDSERERMDIMSLYALAIRRAHEIGGKKFNNKKYGGGIVVQSYSLDATRTDIANLMKRVEYENA